MAGHVTPTWSKGIAAQHASATRLSCLIFSSFLFFGNKFDFTALLLSKIVR